MVLLFFYVFLALVVSFLCSVMEAVLLSVSPAFVAQMKDQGKSYALKLQSFKDNIENPLAAILSLNTIAHTVGAAGAGAQAAVVFGNNYVGIISAVLTFLILVLSEIIPKTLGANFWRELAPVVTRILIPTIWVMWPLVKMSKLLTHILSNRKGKEKISRDEFSALAKLGFQEGVIHRDESRILTNLLKMDQVRVRDIMTPRTVIFTLKESMTVNETLRAHPLIRFSRIPIYKSNRDEISGFVLKNDILLKAAHQEGKVKISEMKRDILVIPQDLPLQEFFGRLLNKRAHIALAVDEYGGTTGIVTLEDLIETLLGTEIMDEGDAVADMRKLAREKWFDRAKRLGIITKDTPLNTLDD